MPIIRVEMFEGGMIDQRPAAAPARRPSPRRLRQCRSPGPAAAPRLDDPACGIYRTPEGASDRSDCHSPGKPIGSAPLRKGGWPASGRARPTQGARQRRAMLQPASGYAAALRRISRCLARADGAKRMRSRRIPAGLVAVILVITARSQPVSDYLVLDSTRWADESTASCDRRGLAIMWPECATRSSWLLGRFRRCERCRLGRVARSGTRWSGISASHQPKPVGAASSGFAA